LHTKNTKDRKQHIYSF